MEFLISLVASGNVLGVGLRHALVSAFIVTLYDVGSDVLGAPGLSQLDTTGVLWQKCSRTFCEAGFP